jgi:general nucleoside transport system permease protein
MKRASANKIANQALETLMPLLSVLAALILGVFVLLILGKDPVEAYTAMFQGAFGNVSGITQTLVKATPLLLVGLGICIAFRGGVINIGGEGQLLVGAISGTTIGIVFNGLSAWALIPMCLFGGALAGAVWGGIPGALKARLGVNEILSTVMMNAIALQFSNFLLGGPLMDPAEVERGTFLPESARIAKEAWLARLVPQTLLHTGAIIAVVMAILVYLLLWRTTIGYRIRAVGLNPDASRYAGINVPFYQALSLTLGGAFAGLAGAVEIMGLHHKLLEGISGGYGFSGIVAALFGKLHPLGAIPASILFGGLLVGGDKMQRAVQVPSYLIMALLGIVVLFVVSSDIWVRRRAQRRESSG